MYTAFIHQCKANNLSLIVIKNVCYEYELMGSNTSFMLSCKERWVRADSLLHIFLIGKTWMKVIWQHESIKYYNKLPQNSLVADIQIFHECWMVLPL